MTTLKNYTKKVNRESISITIEGAGDLAKWRIVDYLPGSFQAINKQLGKIFVESTDWIEDAPAAFMASWFSKSGYGDSPETAVLELVNSLQGVVS